MTHSVEQIGFNSFIKVTPVTTLVYKERHAVKVFTNPVLYIYYKFQWHLLLTGKAYTLTSNRGEIL